MPTAEDRVRETLDADGWAAGVIDAKSAPNKFLSFGGHMRATIQTERWASRARLARFVTVAVLWITPVTSSAQENEILARGRLEYQGYCAACHGENGKGDGIMARYLLIKPADLTQLRRRVGAISLSGAPIGLLMAVKR